jgi:hypothetical protein
LFLRFWIFWGYLRVCKGWGCFRSMASSDNDVLVGMNDFGSSSFNNQEELF